MKSNGISSVLNCVSLEKRETIINDKSEIVQDKIQDIHKNENTMSIVPKKSNGEFDPNIGRTDKNLFFTGDQKNDMKVIFIY